ncbi:MAG: TolC family protein, partial [Cyanobacteria bacterium P01_A01_bin.17]
MLPTASAQAGFTRSEELIGPDPAPLFPGGPVPDDDTTTDIFSTSAQITYDVFTSGQRSASIRAARAAIRAAEDTLDTELQDLRLDVSNDYYDM